MFTGLIDDIGRVDAVADSRNGRELRIGSRYEDLEEGESVAVNGACLTVLDHRQGSFTVAAIVTTLGRTTIAEWRVGRRVNLERALRPSDRLGGHVVQGHVDGVARVLSVRQRDDACLVHLALPAGLPELIAQHGPVAVDGVSLTVNELPSADVLQLALIEYTMRHTTLGDLATGDDVHVEADLFAKYALRLLTPYLTGNKP